MPNPTDLHRFEQLTPTELCDELVRRYHAPLRAELPSLLALARKVESVHAGKAACPLGLTAHLEGLAAALLEHLTMEEQSLFPAVASGPAEWLYATAASLEQEHADVGAQLRRTRELTSGLTPPAEACTSWRELYRRLRELERELLAHIQLEELALFPRILSR
jgi:regulator of cell morphogenesis and NO signaling